MIRIFKVWWDLLANKVELKFTSCSGIMKIIKKSDKTLWLTLIFSCIAFYYANETSNTVNLIPVKNMKMFSFSKHKDICVRIKYLIEVEDGARFAIKRNAGVCATWSSLVPICCSRLEFRPHRAAQTGFSIARVVLFNYLPCHVYHWGCQAPRTRMAGSPPLKGICLVLLSLTWI